MWSSNKWDPRGQHCYVTGGSSGLGLALALLLTQKGADVSIVARDKERLQKALVEIEKVRQHPNQVLQSFSYSLTDAESSEDALKAASQSHGGRYPDAVFLCAGAATPKFFVEESAASLKAGMDNAYWVQALSALPYAKWIAREKQPGKIVFVSSLLGYMSFLGWSSYAPGKHALRGLAETLRSELLLYSSTVHILFPGTILSPGFDHENETKPKITLDIEGDNTGLTSEKVAKKLLQGVQQGEFHITCDFQGDIFRSSTSGSTPHTNALVDGIYAVIGWIGLALWRRDVDKTVLKHRSEHQRYLADHGLAKSS